MEKKSIFSSGLIGLVGIIVALYFTVSIVYKNPILIAGIVVILLYIISYQNTQIDQINKIEERFKIYKELIDIKADIKYLKNKNE